MAKHIQMPPTYPIPNNWTWVELRKLAKIISGFPFDSKLFSDVPTEGRPLIRIRDVVRGYTETYTTEDCPEQYIIHKNDILIGMDGDFNVGRWQDETALLNQRVCHIQSTSDLLLNDYLFYFLPTPLKQINDVTPSVTVKHLSTKTIESIMIPLPPVEEQIRLSELIQSLFAKLDEAKEKAQEVVDRFETRKAAILHKAFSGELTTKWREENGFSFDEWNNKLFDECIEKMQNGLAKRKGSTGVPYVVLRLANLSDDGFITDDLREIALDEKEQKSYKLNVDDIVMIRVNGSKDNVAKQILVTENNLWAFCDHIIRIKYNESVLPEYMVLYSKSEAYKIYVKDNIVSSAGQNTISRKGMARLSIPVPPIEEQKEIANILSNMFDKERCVKETAETVIEQIDTMKKAILARAFRGELGTNDPNEESAIELLKQIL